MMRLRTVWFKPGVYYGDQVLLADWLAKSNGRINVIYGISPNE